MSPTAPRLRQNARLLRKNKTPAERQLWAGLRAHRLEGVHFCAQHPIAGYIVGFCAPRQRLIIEVNGGHHLEQQEYDLQRTFALEQRGYRVLRFWNQQIENELPAVLEAIRLAWQGEPHAPG